jgi:hypothetical protein
MKVVWVLWPCLDGEPVVARPNYSIELLNGEPVAAFMKKHILCKLLSKSHPLNQPHVQHAF